MSLSFRAYVKASSSSNFADLDFLATAFLTSSAMPDTTALPVEVSNIRKPQSSSSISCPAAKFCAAAKAFARALVTTTIRMAATSSSVYGGSTSSSTPRMNAQPTEAFHHRHLALLESLLGRGNGVVGFVVGGAHG
jgi:hypothetical protein